VTDRQTTKMPSRKTVAVFMGTHPEGIKMAPVVAALRGRTDGECRVMATGPHREMFQQVADQFGF
jgi:UDP-N-acetylglucosamine 2-epimerase (non-hydrolysing)